MRDVYLGFRLPWPAKIAAGMLTLGKWRPFEIYLTTRWSTPYFDHTYLGFSSIKSNGFFTKTKETILYFVIITILEHRRTVHASKSKIVVYFRTSNPIFSWHTRLEVGKKTKKKVVE
jgi:hypothetical protein